jgi:hypothetical protein
MDNLDDFESEGMEELDINSFGLRPDDQVAPSCSKCGQESPLDGILSLLNYNGQRSLLVVTDNGCDSEMAAQITGAVVVQLSDFASVEGIFDIIVLCCVSKSFNSEGVQTLIASCRQHMSGSSCIAANFHLANRAEQTNKDYPDTGYRHSPAVLKNICSELRFAFMPTAVKNGEAHWCVIE